MAKISYEFISNYFNENKCILLENQFINAKTKMEYICVCGNTSKITWDSFRSGTRCRKCQKNKMSEKFRHSYEYVNNYFTKNNCKLLEKTYVNAQQKLKYICSCGNQSYITFNAFNNGSRCKVCGSKKSNIKRKYTYDIVCSDFKNNGCKLLEEKYVGANEPIKYRCNCGDISQISYYNFRRGQRCKKCGIKKNSGKNHVNWKADRGKHELFLKCKQKCRKILEHSLNMVGHKKCKRIHELLGYTPDRLMKHITEHSNWLQVKDGIWHLDHIFPIIAFVEHGITDIKLINCLENLQPLSAKENLSKSDKYNKQKFHEWLKLNGVFLDITNKAV